MILLPVAKPPNLILCQIFLLYGIFRRSFVFYNSFLHVNCTLRWIYWTESDKISRSRLDGSAKQTLFNDEILQPSGIVVDIFKQRLLWGDTGSIQYSSLNGTGRTTLLSVDGLPFQLGILGDHLAWTSLGSSHFSLMKLYDDTAMPSSLTLLVPSAEILPLVGLAVISSGQRISKGNLCNCKFYCLHYYCCTTYVNLCTVYLYVCMAMILSLNYF